MAYSITFSSHIDSRRPRRLALLGVVLLAACTCLTACDEDDLNDCAIVAPALDVADAGKHSPPVAEDEDGGSDNGSKTGDGPPSIPRDAAVGDSFGGGCGN
jgi:hypothetical protein